MDLVEVFRLNAVSGHKVDPNFEDIFEEIGKIYELYSHRRIEFYENINITVSTLLVSGLRAEDGQPLHPETGRKLLLLRRQG